jgi:hypothetical protein
VLCSVSLRPDFSVGAAAVLLNMADSTSGSIGYMLNFARENVLILRKKDFGVIAFLLLLEMDRFFSDWLLDTPELLFLW